LDGEAATGVAEEVGIFSVAADVDGEGEEFEVVFGEEFFEADGAEAGEDVVEVGAAGVGGPDVDGMEAECGDALAGLFDGEFAVVDGGGGEAEGPRFCGEGVEG